MTLPLFDPMPGPGGTYTRARPVLTGWRPVLVYEFDVYGDPAPQGSKRVYVDQRTGRRGVAESSEEKVKSWRSEVRMAALDRRNGDLGLLDGPLMVDAIFTFVRPAGHYGTGRNARVLKPSAPPRPAVKPDLSKIIRSTEDALTGVLYRDDSRITEYGRLLKVYAGEDRDALEAPGARIRIFALEPR